jgi:hypothetical protein
MSNKHDGLSTPGFFQFTGAAEEGKALLISSGRIQEHGGILFSPRLFIILLTFGDQGLSCNKLPSRSIERGAA